METVDKALRKVPLLHGLSQAELRLLARRTELRDYPPGAIIVAQNEAGGTLYLIVKGRVRVVRHGQASPSGAPLAEYGPGDFFGEMALLENVPRSADVLATTPTTCALLSREVFQECLLANRDVATVLLATLSRRLRALSELVERPRVETRAPPRERERRILEQGETAMANDIRAALVIKEHNHFTLFDPAGNIPSPTRPGSASTSATRGTCRATRSAWVGCRRCPW